MAIEICQHDDGEGDKIISMMRVNGDKDMSAYYDSECW